MAEAVVFDASAILALVQQEARGGEVLRALHDPGRTLWISAVNLCEVATKLVRMGHTATEVLIVLEPFERYVVNFGTDHAKQTAELSRWTRSLGLSLGDRACLTLAASRGATAWTTDAAWLKLKIGVKVLLLRG